jgi:hypothetical protein
MPKTNFTSRDYRVLVRDFTKVKKELSKTKQNAKSFTKFAFARKALYDKEENTLRQSLQNFSKSYYKQKKELKRKKFTLCQADNEVRRLRQIAAKQAENLKKANEMIASLNKYRKAYKKHKKKNKNTCYV